MDSKLYTDYQILKSIEENPELSQRLMSKQTGVNVASVNFALKRLVHRGHVKITTMNKRRIIYHLTSEGITQKGALAYKFFIRNYNLFSDIREIILLKLDKPELRGKKLAIFGVNEISEIVYLCIKKNGFQFAGIFENKKKVDTKWIDCKIKAVETLKNNKEVDYVIDIKSGAKDILNFEILTPGNLIKKYSAPAKRPPANDTSSMKSEIEIFGAKSGVTGSCALVKANGKKILIDCGLYQGGREDSPGKNDHFPFDPKEIDYLLLTHAHIDHAGRIPQLIDQGFRGEILSHHASVEICPCLLDDVFQFNPGFNFNLSREKLRERVIDQSWGFEYGRWNQISKGITFRLLDAGHILGSATIQLNINGEYIVFSGDIGNKNTGILRDPKIPDRADVLILESTYGGRSHNEIDTRAVFQNIVRKAVKDGGKVLIPAFAIGRTQEIIYQLNDLLERGDIPDISVFVDTPWGVKIAELYDKYKECFDSETIKRLEHKDDPLDFDKLFGAEKHRDSLDLNDIKGPAVIIAGSAMCTGGRIINHLGALLEDEKTSVIFAGYQAADTLGDELLKSVKKECGHVNINGKQLDVKASIHTISGFSAHADHNGLIDWVGGICEKPRSIHLNHGDTFGQNELKKSFNEKYPYISVMCGFYNEN